jgi:hypothetical protein
MVTLVNAALSGSRVGAAKGCGTAHALRVGISNIPSMKMIIWKEDVIAGDLLLG